MEDFLTFMIWPIMSLIIILPVYYLTFTLGFRWIDFMHSLKAKSFFYTKFGLKFGTTERIQDFGTFVFSCLMSAVMVAILFYPLIYL